ncbi:MAG TPA: TerB family tellurite resistance protein [Bacteroidia bacterium]|nr:TerB family tellurite resistance protein [Bacteroidia bacterium]
MSSWNKWLFGGLGWAVGGPIGAIIGFALGSLTENEQLKLKGGTQRGTLPGDFGSALLILCGALMKADNQVKKSELEYVKTFFTRQFGAEYTRERMLLFRELLKQDYSVSEVCLQIKNNLDYSSRLELIHLLFGLARADGDLHAAEISFIEHISGLLEIKLPDFVSIKAMFVKDKLAAYKILEIDVTVSDEELKKAYRRMAVKYHPDKVHHLGPDFRKDAEEKFKKINEAYEIIKKERGIN